jgi:hypothetical protein
MGSRRNSSVHETLKSFGSLLDSSDGAWPPDVQDRAAAELPRRIRDSAWLDPWTSDAQPGEMGQYVVLGVAAYSRPELELLDALESRLAMRPSCGVAVLVFPLSECQSETDVQKRIPMIGRVLSTPVIGIWNDGKVVKTAQGIFDVRRSLDELGLATEAS